MEPKLPEFPGPKPPTLADKVPRMGEKIAAPVREVLGDKGIGKVIGDLIGGVLGTLDGVVTGIAKVGDGVVESIDRMVREPGRRG